MKVSYRKPKNLDKVEIVVWNLLDRCYRHLRTPNEGLKVLKQLAMEGLKEDKEVKK